MRILVTGANGFVGRRLCTFLGEQGHEVLRTVRLHDGFADTTEINEVSPKDVLQSACAGMDCVVHLAAAVHVMGAVDAKLRGTYQLTNVDFTRRLAEAAHTAGVRRFVFVSSIKVCGEISQGRPLREIDAGHPSDPYAISKWAAEQALRLIEAECGIEVVIVRPPLIYGRDVRANFLALLSVVNLGLPLPFSLLGNRRSLIYLENFVSALAACVTHPRAAGETFHVSDAGAVTLPELVEKLSWAMGKSVRIFPFPKVLLRLAGGAIGRYQQIDRLINELEVDDRKIHNLLGWYPNVSFSQGVEETVSWYLNVHSSRVNRWKSRKSDAALVVGQLCAVDFTLKHLLLPLVEGMQSEGWSVTAVCSDGQYVKDMRRHGYKLHTVEISRNLFKIPSHLRAIWSIYNLCNKEQFDVLHVHTPIAALLGRIAGRMGKVPIIVYTAHGFYFHDQMPWWKYRFFVSLERWSGSLTDYLFTQSSEDAESAIAERIVPRSKVTAIGNGVCVDLFRPDPNIRTRNRIALGIPADAYVIGVVARLVREKGLVEFLDAAVTLGDRFPHTHFLIVGERLPSDHDASIEWELHEAQERLGSRLMALGYRVEVSDLLSAMDLFCLPSYREGMPRSIIEAMMMELPVVATDIRGSREEVLPGETGLLVPTRDVSALTRALDSLISDPERGLRMGKAGRKRALDVYDERKVIERQIGIISELCADRSHAIKKAASSSFQLSDRH